MAASSIAAERVTHHPTRVGSGLIRALEKIARARGAQVLLEYRMTRMIREHPLFGKGTSAVAPTPATTSFFRNSRRLISVLCVSPYPHSPPCQTLCEDLRHQRSFVRPAGNPHHTADDW